ncbi:hypothetical protein DTO207G8_3261 [Paecilomyces variotii]|nr:hypothetical protein DTO169E5_5806 [Paecilomyces variotii]KAJ9255077.1 hypothetical protein DTO207G8_3261 [Paecilomyces variotii]KAJ9259546.1 hypothetical protein DTO195F2_4890 [Paecilomyces variotii]KAJ9368944.1 hypothetical protein DTO282E5_6402 [Paecilomyces variotii]
MPADPSSLYGIPRPRNAASKKDLTSSSTLAFTTQLSSLIAQGGTSTPKSESKTSSGRVRSSKSSKSDIFSVHNKGAQKRAAADLEDDDDSSAFTRQKHQRAEDIGQVDAATLQRSKRRMEEKVRVYEELKSGAHLAEASSSDEEDMTADDHAARMRRREKNALVDFDRKWAEEERKRLESGERSDEEDQTGDEEGDGDADETGSLVEYEDEFGRSRRGTRAEAARAARLRAEQEDPGARGEPHDRSRPARPSNLIYGEAIQSAAFNPDAPIAAQMSYLAARRDRSATPPAETHYDADAEVRSRGTGFYAFSRDAETRRKEMEELERARKETEKVREERRARKSERDRLKEERKKKIQELRGKKQAEAFLESLGDLGAIKSAH